MNVNITEEHIKRGLKDDCQRCAIALAINDILPPSYFAHVGWGNFNIFRQESNHKKAKRVFVYRPPDNIWNKVTDFDRFVLEPFSFELPLENEEWYASCTN